MSQPSKRFLLLLVALQSFPTTFFLNGEPFYAQNRFNWTSQQIALSQALVGLCIALGSYGGGHLAHRRGPRFAMVLGLWICLSATLAGWAGSAYSGASVLFASLLAVSIGQALIWPGLEALLMGGESPERTQDYVGRFNITWSLGTATAIFGATPLIHWLGPEVFFLLPALLFVINLSLVLFFLSDYRPETASEVGQKAEVRLGPHLSSEQRSAYRWLAWLANPFIYIAINVIVSYNPAIGTRLGLGAAASIWTSVWFFVRAFAFDLLRRSTRWHYRWRLLILGFAVATVSFALLILAPDRITLVAAQIAFGLSVGFIYQSSLLYSMAESETPGTHGGFHESFIGLGQMLGPLIAIGGAQMRPTDEAFPIWLVLGSMLVGLVILIGIGKRLGKLV